MKRKKNLLLDREDLAAIFDPVVDRTVELVQEQIESVLIKTEKKPKEIILVGGFGRNDYLRIRLQSSISKAIGILQGSGNRHAISRGAVIRGLMQRDVAAGLSVMIKSRISRLSYGTTSDQEFDPDLGDKKYKYWCEDEHQWRAERQMKWFLRQNRLVLHFTFSTMNLPRRCHRPYTRPPPGRRRRVWSLDNNVKKLCTITWTKKLDFGSLPRYTNPVGKVFSKVNFTVNMTCVDGNVDFPFMHDGKQVGSKNVSVDF
ncbi:hypothetical protein CMUS01_03915 [Colletotrichum musicola]|uniref:Hsp70-like protein n=1 Tax=Colletotrichum musicola TaxID=2175873 RepID=A0A8H6NPZ7_9PEZI|nr:hypothetical protein CMUS01_03915 [Colletotrichum musicola]